jgi:hypothetical protein
MGMVILGIPLTVNVLAVWHWRGRYGRLPVIVLVVLGLAFVVDVVGAMQGGNLAGVWSIIAGPPAMLLLIVRAVAQRPQPSLQYSPMLAVCSLVVVLLGIVILPYQFLSLMIGLHTFGLLCAVILALLLLWRNFRQRHKSESPAQRQEQ